MTKTYWHTQEVLFLTEHFGKPYFYLRDVDGHIYLTKAKPIEETSTDGTTGESINFISGYEPDLV